MTNVVFVAPYLAAATLRFAEAATRVPGARVGLLSQEPLERVPESIRARLAGHWRVENALDAEQLVVGVRGIAGQIGPVSRLLGILEPLQEPLARARELLGIEGVGEAVARNFRDKARMKDVLRAAGLPCAKHALVRSVEEGFAAARSIGFPLVVKPPDGMGAAGTFRIDDERGLREAFAIAPPQAAAPTLIEEFVVGDELSFDSVIVEGRLVWRSFSRYLPTPLDVLRNPWIQWCVLLPRSIDEPIFDEMTRVGEAALRALGLRTGFSHMEWFRRGDGSIAISEVGARPPGAQFTSLISWAHEHDFYRAWARLASGGGFDPPQRRYAVGAAYLRAQGTGKRVVRVEGLEAAQAELGPLVVEAKLPEQGRPRSDGYEGDGYAILRHPETAIVERGLARLVSMIRVVTE